MYIFLVSSPRWWTAVLWGLLLEGVMLLTPYAEVFGYRIGSQFLAITIGAHVIYGLALWAALKYWTGGVGFDVKLKKTRRAIWGAFVFSILGIAAIGADFYHRYEGKLAASPPAYIGPHLYVTWDELELDRVASAWVWQRFVEKQARFHFVPVFSRIERGTPFDIPEAKIRRSATRSTTELLVTQQQLEGDLKLVLLARMTHLYEIVPWMATSDPTAVEMARALNMAMGKGKITSAPVAAKLGFAYLDAWYVRLESQKVVPD